MVTGDTTVRWQLTESLWPGRDLEEVGVAARDPGQLRVTPPGDLCLRNPFLADPTPYSHTTRLGGPAVICLLLHHLQ